MITMMMMIMNYHNNDDDDDDDSKKDSDDIRDRHVLAALWLECKELSLLSL